MKKLLLIAGAACAVLAVTTGSFQTSRAAGFSVRDDHYVQADTTHKKPDTTKPKPPPPPPHFVNAAGQD